MKNSISLLVLLVCILTTGCKKDNEFEQAVFIRIHNHTINKIDSVRIHSTGVYVDPIVIYNIDSLSLTEFQRAVDVFYLNSFLIFLNDTTITDNWEMPYLGTATQPREESWPAGYYTIGIYQFDSTIRSISIALDEYEKSYY